MNILVGMMKLWISLGSHAKLDYFGGSFLYILGLFLKVKVQNWNIFFGGLLYFFSFPPLGPHQ